MRLPRYVFLIVCAVAIAFLIAGAVRGARTPWSDWTSYHATDHLILVFAIGAVIFLTGSLAYDWVRYGGKETRDRLLSPAEAKMPSGRLLVLSLVFWAVIATGLVVLFNVTGSP